MISWPTAVPEQQVSHISRISSLLATSRNIELTIFWGKKELSDFSDAGILLAKLGPILLKSFTQKISYFLWIGNFMRICPKNDGNHGLFFLFIFIENFPSFS